MEPFETRLVVRVTRVEKQTYTRAAKAVGRTLAGWVRHTLKSASAQKGRSPHADPRRANRKEIAATG
jgi:hypothetical protein